jgi:hypothetical protein
VLAAVRLAYERLLEEPGRASKWESHWIATSLVRAMLPHYSPDEQLDLILRLPHECPLYFNLRVGLRPLAAEALEARLAGAGSPQELGRVLFFASGAAPELTSRARSIISECLSHSDPTIAGCAAEIILNARDPEIYDLLLEQDLSVHPVSENSWVADRQSDAIAAAVAAKSRKDLILRISPRSLERAAVEMGGVALELLADFIERSCRHMLLRVAAEPPQDINVFLEVSEDGREGFRAVEEKRRDGSHEDLLAALSDVSHPDKASLRFSERHKAMVSEFEAYERAVLQDGVSQMLNAPPSKGLETLMLRDPTRVGAWVDAILASRDDVILRQIRNFGLSLARAFATHDPQKAAQLFRYLKDHVPSVNIIVGQEEMPFYEYALFHAADSQAITALRRETLDGFLNDCDLQLATVTAEVCGAAAWLDRHIEGLIISGHPGLQARGLTIAGFRQRNDCSKKILGQRWGSGFLGQAAATAQKNYRRAEWARRWLEETACAADPVDFWRFGKLAEGVVDMRFMRVFQHLPETELLMRFRAELYDRLKKAAQERLKKGKSKLFGLDAPPEDIVSALHDVPR